MIFHDIKPVRTKSLTSFYNWLKNYGKPGIRKCCLLYGEVGVGKTYTVNIVAKMIGYNVIYVRKEDIEQLDRLIRLSLRKKFLVHLDRPYTELKLSGRRLKRLVSRSVVPIVFEDELENRKYYEHLDCEQVRVESPPVYWIGKIIREKAIIPSKLIDLKRISRDVRQSLLMIYGSKPETETSFYGFIEKFLMGGNARGLKRPHLPMIIDNIHNFYGVELVKLVSRLVMLDKVLPRTPEEEVKWNIDLSVFLSDVKPIKPTKNIENYYYVKLKEVKKLEE